MQKKYIYKLTNNINGKVYIGQTNNLQRREQQHRRANREENKLLYYAIKKYGEENFSFECLEDLCEDYNEKEKYWINKFRSYIGYEDCNGYNMTEGGENPPINYGENNPACIHSDEEVNLVIYYLLETTLSSEEISKITGYDCSAIKRINNGKLRKKENLNYPLRKEMSFEYLDDRADLIIQDLLNSDLTQKEIAQKYNVGRTTVTAINRGQNHKRDNLDYPIRQGKTIRKSSKKVELLDKETLKPIKRFESLNEAARYVGKTKGSYIAECINNNKMAWGYLWRFAEE